MMQLAAIFGALSIAATPAYATNMVVAWQQQTFWAFSPCGDAGSGDPHRHLLVPRPSRLKVQHGVSAYSWNPSSWMKPSSSFGRTCSAIAIRTRWAWSSWSIAC